MGANPTPDDFAHALTRVQIALTLTSLAVLRSATDIAVRPRPARRAAGPERVKRVDPLQLAKPLKWPALAIGVPGESCSSGAAPADGALGGLPAREQLNLFSHYV